MTVRIETYRPQMEESWLDCWALAASRSRAWYHMNVAKPTYKGPSLELVALEEDGRVVGLLDLEIETIPGSLCLRQGPGQAFAWELAVHPGFWGRGLGKRLIREAEALLRAEHGVTYSEWWSMDERSQEWYRRQGMEEINRHMRFHVLVPPDMKEDLSRMGAGPVNLHLTCSEDDWPRLREELEVILAPPLEPRLCVGFAHRF